MPAFSASNQCNQEQGTKKLRETFIVLVMIDLKENLAGVLDPLRFR